MSVSFALKLIDLTSGPAAAAAASLARVEGKLKALQQATGVNMGAPLASIGRGASGAVSALASVGSAAASALVPIGALAGGLVLAGASYAGHLAKFSEDSTFAFKKISGSQEKAAEIMTMADEMARSMGVKTMDVTKSLRELMGSGFKVDAAKAIVSAQMDIKAINPDAKLDNMNQALAKMAGSGKFQLEQAESILGAGVNDDVFYSILTKMTGSKNRADVFKKISAGLVTDQQGLSAMLQAVQEMQGGKALGSASQEKAQSTVGGAMTNAIGMFERLFQAINTSALGGKLIELANIAAKLFDPAQPGGQRFLALLNSAVDLGMMVFKGLDSGSITSTFDAVISAGQAVISFMEPLVQGFTSGFGEAASAVRMIVNEFGIGQGQATSMSNALKLVGNALGWVAVGVGVAAGGLAWLVAKIAGMEAFLWGAAASIGIAIIEGITGGLDSAKEGLLSHLRALAELLPDSVRKLLKIQSPSRVFAEIGVNTMRGFEVGIQRGPDPTALLADRVQAPSTPAVDAPAGRFAVAGSPAEQGARSVNVNVRFERIDVSGTTDPASVAVGLKSVIRAEMVSFFEREALSVGAAVPA